MRETLRKSSRCSVLVRVVRKFHMQTLLRHFRNTTQSNNTYIQDTLHRLRKYYPFQ